MQLADTVDDRIQDSSVGGGPTEGSQGHGKPPAREMGCRPPAAQHAGDVESFRLRQAADSAGKRVARSSNPSRQRGGGDHRAGGQRQKPGTADARGDSAHGTREGLTTSSVLGLRLPSCAVCSIRAPARSWSALELDWNGPHTMVIAGPEPMTYQAFARAVAMASGVSRPRFLSLPPAR